VPKAHTPAQWWVLIFGIDAPTLLRTMLAGKRGPSAARRGLVFSDPTLGLELPPLNSTQITPPTPEQAWSLINAAKAIGGIG
jgi:hypothetical protein